MPHNNLLQNAQSAIRRHSHELKFPGGPDTTRELVARITAWIRPTRQLIETHKLRVSSEYVHGFQLWTGRRPENAVPADHGGWLKTLRFGAWAAVALECLFSAILSVVTLNLNLPMAAAVGVILTLCLTAVSKAVCRIWAAREELRPQKALHGLNVALFWVLPLWILAFIGAVQFGRVITEATTLSLFVFGSLMSTLTVCSPIVAGLLFAACDIRSWAQRCVVDWVFLESLEHALTELEETCRNVQTGMAPSNSVPGPGDDDDGACSESFGGVAAAVLLILVCAAPRVAAQDLCELWIDKSGSPAAFELRNATERSLQLIARLAADANGPQACSLFAFAGGAFHATSFHDVRFPQRPSEACAPPPRNELSTFFRLVAQNSRAEAERLCEQSHREARTKYDENVRQQIQIALGRLMTYEPSVPNRTCLVDLLQRFSRSTKVSPRFRLILTDGEETCSPAKRDALPVPTNRSNVVMALVPGSQIGGSPAERHLRLAEGWLKIAPWVAVIGQQELDERILRSGK